MHSTHASTQPPAPTSISDVHVLELHSSRSHTHVADTPLRASLPEPHPHRSFIRLSFKTQAHTPHVLLMLLPHT